MKKIKLFFLFLMVLCVTATAQPPVKKPCKTCGKAISECPYKGRHPEPDNQVPSKPNKPQATTGTLSITSTPSDAVVKIDGEYMGTTPLTLKNRKAGTYKVTFSAEGYETQTKSVTVTAGKTATCSATLKKKQAQQPVVQQPVQQPVVQQSTTTTTTSASSQTFTANGVSFKMIRVEGATSGTFYIGETEVTQALWQAVMGSNPSHFKGENFPVEKVSWDDCKAFISKLNSITGKTFRLPKEAEWEYAAKGGNKSRGYEYSGSNTLDEVGWYYENSGNSRLDDSSWDVDKLNSNGCCTHPVRQKKANELGIYDMSGNVWEWCENLYSSSSSIRVNRGGGWGFSARDCRVSYRYSNSPGNRSISLGLRLVL